MNAANDTPIIYVIDDDSAMRDALKDLFASVGLEAETFASVRAFLDCTLSAPALSGRPACLVLDVRMPEQSGTDFHLQMPAFNLHIPVIFITGHGDIAMGVKAIKSGAVEFLTKPFRDHDLLEAVQQGIEKDRRRLRQRQIVSELESRWQSLSVGERDVCALVVQGLLNKQIAARLGVQEVTVKVRRARVMQKMRASSLADLVRLFDALAAVHANDTHTGDTHTVDEAAGHRNGVRERAPTKDA